MIFIQPRNPACYQQYKTCPSYSPLNQNFRYYNNQPLNFSSQCNKRMKWASLPKTWEGEKHSTPTYPIHNIHIQEEGDFFVFSMDLPGVKSDDMKLSVAEFVLTIEGNRKSSDGKALAKFQRKFLMDKKSVDPSADIKASLSDGVLLVKIPKKPTTEAVVILPSLSEPQLDEKSGTTFRFQVELPGVKPNDLEITLDGDRLSISAKRKYGSSFSKIERSFAIDDNKIDGPKMSAYLVDGILTVVAPKRSEVPSTSKKIVPVASFSDGSSEKEEAVKNTVKATVETVEDEEDEVEVYPQVVARPIPTNETKEAQLEHPNAEASLREDKSENPSVKEDADYELDDYELLNCK